MKINDFTYTHYDDYSEEAFPYSRKVKVTGLQLQPSSKGIMLMSVRITERGKGSCWIDAEEFYKGLNSEEAGEGPVKVVVCAKEIVNHEEHA